MVDITHKSNTLREAVAQAVVKVSKADTIAAIQNDMVPKGNVFAMSRAAGLLGIKKTPELLPDCHPLPIEYAAIDLEAEGLSIFVKVTVKTIYKTGVEVEAMHGASVAALNIYDMLKPIDKGVEIHHIKLLKKKGGKSSRMPFDVSKIKAQVIVCSDTISRGANEDLSGKVIQERLQQYQIDNDLIVIPDEEDLIRQNVSILSKEKQLIILTGGTGLSPRDATPEAIVPLLDKRIQGAEETIRRYGQDRTRYAMLSRSVVGTIDNRCIVMAIPGSTKAVTESMDAVLPELFHVYNVMKGTRHS